MPDTSNSAHTEIILGYKPDLVGFSATTSGFLDGYELAERIKTARPEILTPSLAAYIYHLLARPC